MAYVVTNRYTRVVVKSMGKVEVHCNLRVLMAKQRPRVTQRELAEATGLSTNTVSRLAQDKADRIDFTTIQKLCEFFGLTSLDELFSVEYVAVEDLTNDQQST